MRKITALVAVSGALFLPSQALAQVSGYSSLPQGTVQTQIGPSPTPAPNPSVSTPSPATHAVAAAQQTTPKSSLPFTGLDVGIVAAAGLALLAAGFTMRKLSASRSNG